MPKKIPPMSSRGFVRLLTQGSATFVRQKGTSHAIFERIKGETIYRVPVVMAKKELSPKYMKVVFHQLGFTNEEIEALLE